MEQPPNLLRVLATPVVESVNIQTMYDIENAMVLGRGGFSHVIGVLHLQTNTMRALKVINREKMKGNVAKMVMHEREILRRTSHPNIITLHESIMTPHHIYFALDMMSGDLFTFIVRNKYIPEPVARRIMHQLLCGILYLHGQCIVHRDIKPENILINITDRRTSVGSKEGAESTELGWDDAFDIEVKLADFGLAKLVQQWDVHSTPCGTSFYIAPEIIRSIEEQGAKPLCTTRQLVKSVDVWSAGVVLFVMLSGRPPFHGQVKTSEERRCLLKCIDHGVLFNKQHGWDAISEEAKDLIVKMLDQDSARRLTALQALEHPFFRNHGYDLRVYGGVNFTTPKQEMRSSCIVPITGPSESNTQAGEWDCATAPNHEVTKKRGVFRNLFCKKISDKKPSHIVSMKPDQLAPRAGELGIGVEGDGESGEMAVEGGGEEKLMRIMQKEIDAIQQDIIATGDKDGEETSYLPTILVRTAPRAARPVVMNAKVKVGPGAVKK